MVLDALADLKNAVRAIGSQYSNRLDRARRLFIEERCSALNQLRAVEYQIKSDVSGFFGIDYANVCFTGSAQLGFSPHKNTMFTPGTSDLDIACVSVDLFQRGWIDIVSVTRAFSDHTTFGALRDHEISTFKETIVKRGMIRVAQMPKSSLSTQWRRFEEQMSRKYAANFGSISFAVYMNEYAFCWKQDSALVRLFPYGGQNDQ